MSGSPVSYGTCHTVSITNNKILTTSIMMPSVVAVTGGVKPFVTMQSISSGSAKVGICNMNHGAAMGGTVTVGYVIH